MDSLNWWGRAGVQHSWEQLEFAGLAHPGGPREGVSRYVDPNVSWESGLPWDMLDLPRWYADPSYEGHYEMPLPARPTRQTIASLRELSRSLARTPPKDQLDPRVLELESVVDRLLEVAGKLHAAGYRLGLLHVDNILVVRGTGGRDLILPDLGFVVATDTYAADWLSSQHDALCAPLSPWEQHQHKGLAKTGPEPDVRLLARLIASALIGGQDPGAYSKGVDVPEDGAPWVVPQSIPPMANVPRLFADIWGVLGSAVPPSEQQVRTVAELAAGLRANPIRDHFGKPKKGPTGSGTSPLLMVFGTAVVGTAALVGWWLLVKGPNAQNEQVPSPLSPVESKEPPPPLPNESELTKVEPVPPPNQATFSDFHKRAVGVISARSSPKPDVRRIEEQVRENARWELIKRVRKEEMDLWTKFQDNPVPFIYDSLVPALSALKKSITDVRELAKSQNQLGSKELIEEEQKCIEHLESRLRSLDHSHWR